ncbi:MAG: ATP-binding cassette domain-containing protein [Chitinophagaceae bacterium]|nr:ATP-binding cassette domain-containing protein [Chitinophagaceae bacterium]
MEFLRNIEKMLSGNKISKSIGGRKILSEIDISIKVGEIVALIGPSGGGKSTLLRNLSLLEKPDTGRITIENRQFNFPMNGKSLPNHIHPLVSVVFQQFHLWPHLRVKDNLLMPLRQQQINFNQAEFDELINYFEVNDLLKRFPHQISVGQKQRIAFIRAVLLRPKYLLLDEITSALDIQHIGKMLQFIKKLSENGTGILIATHLIGFAANVSSQIIFLNEGRIIERGDKSILKNPQTEVFTDFLTYIDYAG